VDERARVEEAVRAFFEASNEEAPERATGAAYRSALVSRKAAMARTETTAEFRRLETTQLDDGRAVADVDVTLTTALDHPMIGHHEQKRRAQGPVELVREHGVWKVADYTIDARTVSMSSWEPRGAVDVDGVAFAIPLVRLQRYATVVYLDVHNARERTVIVLEAWRGRRSIAGSWRYSPIPLLGVRGVESARSVTTYAGWQETFDVDTSELRIVVRAGEADAAAHIEAQLSVTSERVELVPAVPRRARISVRVRKWLMWLPFALIAILMLAHATRAAAVVVLLYAAYAAYAGVVAVMNGMLTPRLALNYALWIGALLVFAYLLAFGF
jgi:hypothetical protein